MLYNHIYSKGWSIGGWTVCVIWRDKTNLKSWFVRICPFLPRLIAAEWEVCHGLGGEVEQCWSDRRGALQGEGTGGRRGEGYPAVVVGGSNTAVLGHTFAQDVRSCVRGCTRSSFSSSVSPHGSPLHSSSPGTQVAAVAIKEPRLLLSNSLAPLSFLPPFPLEQKSQELRISPFVSLFIVLLSRERSLALGKRTPCSWSRSWSLTVQPVTGSAHSTTAMEYLKFCFVFSCWLKFANSVSSTETPQAPAPIPKGEQNKTIQNKLSPIAPEIQWIREAASYYMALVELFLNH